jgi:serine/threonine-protein phosphatase 2B catalytic subunit
LSYEVLSRNKLTAIIRAHEVQQEGFKMHHWTGPNFPTIITIFSAPNYCDYYKNKGAVVKFLNNAMTVQPYT